MVHIKYTRFEIFIRLIAKHKLIYTCKSSPQNSILTSMSLIKKIRYSKIIKLFRSFPTPVLDY